MIKSTAIMKQNFSLGDITTYQSGVVQSNAQRVIRSFTNTYLIDHNLTTMQWFIIGTLLDAGQSGMRLTDLAQSVTTTLGYLTNTLNLLEAKGMITRTTDETDSRTKLVAVAESFLPKCTEIEQDLRKKMRKTIYASITPEELTIYIQVLYKLSVLSPT